MPVPTSIDDLSTTAGSNSPSGSETPTEGDNYIRTLSAFIALLRDKLDGTGPASTLYAGSTIDGLAIGFKTLPRSTTETTSTTSDVGKCIAVSAGIAIPNSTFAPGDALMLYNDSAAAVTITASITTLRLAGTTLTGNRTLAARGFATVWFNSATEAVITGAGVS